MPRLPDMIAARSAEEWRPIFAAADCCATIVAPLEEAMRDPHFVERGLFAHKIDRRFGQVDSGFAATDCASVSRSKGARTKAPLHASAVAARRAARRPRA